MTRSKKRLLVGALVLVSGLPACGGETANTTPPVSATDAPIVSEQRPCVTPPFPAMRPRRASGEEIPESEWPAKGPWPKEVAKPRLIAGRAAPVLSVEQMMDNSSSNILLLARCTLHVDGTVSDCHMICSNSDPLYDATILETTEGQRYTPVVFRGRPIEIPFNFQYRIIKH